MSKTKIFVVVIILIIVFSIALFVYRNLENKKKLITYTSVKVTKDELEVLINATGSVKASSQIDIKSEIGGKVVELPVEEGDTVSKGDTIAVIDDTQLKEEYTQAEADYTYYLAQLDQAQTTTDLQSALTDTSIAAKEKELDRAEMQYKQAIDELEEQKDLSQGDIESGKASLLISQKQLDQALAGNRQQDIAEGLEQVNQAQVTMENAKKELDRQKELYKKDYVALQGVDDAEKAYLLAESQYKAAKENYDLLLEGSRKEDIAIYEAQVEEAKKNLDYKKLNAKQTIASMERDVELAYNDLLQAQIALREAINNSLQVNINQDQVLSTRAQLDKADASRKQAQDELFKTKIVSPIDGIIIDRSVDIGDVVASQTMSSAVGTTLMTIADLNELYAEGDIDEADIGKITKDMAVNINASAYPNLKIPGDIKFIASQAVLVQQIPTFRIKIKILLDKIPDKDLPPGKTRYELLYPGMSVDADIIVTEKKDVLQLPLEAVWEKDGKSYVTLVTGINSFKDVEINVGIRNDIAVEITGGLKEGQEVKIPEVKDSDKDSDSNSDSDSEE